MNYLNIKLPVLASSMAVLMTAQPNISNAAEDTIERIEVTGSRIKRKDVEGPSPVQTITRDDIEKTGLDNLQQIFERLPISGVGTFSTRGNSQDSTANGAAAISLRGFGADATLVLINGRRIAISAFAENIVNSFVDINSIPVAAIERIEILKDGASAVYGSDAVAGVVNIILRKDFTGTEVTARYGGSDANYEKSASMVWGIGTEKSNATLILDYFLNSELGNNEISQHSTANQAPFGGMDFRSSRGFPGRYIVDGVTTIDPDCPEDRAFGATCVFDYGPFGLIAPAAERVGAILQMSTEVNDSIELFAEMAVQHNTSEAGGAATPLDGDAGLTVPANHPNNPFGEDIDINRHRTVDAGPRRWDIESDSMRLLVGARGELTDEWEWEIGVQKGRSESTQTGNRTQGWVRTDFLQQEIDAGRYNPFGGTINSQDVIDNITTSLVRQGESHITSIDAFVSGELFEMDGGNVGMVVGLEYRDEDAKDIPDDQFVRGLIFGTESVSASAQRDQWAAFVEFMLPVTEEFELNLAVRHDDYDDFGNTTNPKVSMRWNPLENVVLRASWSEGFRAPSLAQIGLGPSQESQFFTDTYKCPDPSDESNPACAATDYTIVFAGNPDLKAEESETWNVGVVWEINDDLDVGFDIWNITQDNKIDEVPFGMIYDSECNNQNSTICIRLDPLPGETLGELSEVHNTFFNVSSQEADGIDFSANYALDLNDMGNVKLSLNWSYLNNFEKGGLDYTGEYNYPEHRWASAVDWELNDWRASMVISYIGEFEDTPDADFDGTLDFEENSSRMVDAMVTVDLQLNYTTEYNAVYSIGAINVLDEDAPFAIGDGDSDLYGYVTGMHNPRGRMIYGEVNFRF